VQGGWCASRRAQLPGWGKHKLLSLKFWEFTRKGAIVTVVSILLAASYLWLRYFLLTD
jgi:hypothetical protein